MSRIRVNPDHLSSQEANISSIAAQTIRYADQVMKAANSAPSYGGQFGPKVKAIAAKAYAEGNNRRQVLSSHSEDLSRRSSIFKVADESGAKALTTLSGSLWGQVKDAAVEGWWGSIFNDFKYIASFAIRDKKKIKSLEELEKTRKRREFSPQEDMDRINPFYGAGTSEVRKNCVNCTAAYVLRRRGYDVAAGFDSDGNVLQDVVKWYKNAKIESLPNPEKITRLPAEKQYTEIVAQLISLGNGAAGHLSTSAKNADVAHTVFFEIVNEKLIIRDCQSNKVYESEEEHRKYFKLWEAESVMTIRTDNVEVSEEILEHIRKA